MDEVVIFTAPGGERLLADLDRIDVLRTCHDCLDVGVNGKGQPIRELKDGINLKIHFTEGSAVRWVN